MEETHDGAVKLRRWILKTIGWLLKLFGLLLILFAVMVVIGIGYLRFTHTHALQQVQAYCQSVSIGTSIAGLSERARAQGLHIEVKQGSADLTGRIHGAAIMAFPKAFWVAQVVCVIDHDGTAATATRVIRGEAAIGELAR